MPPRDKRPNPQGNRLIIHDAIQAVFELMGVFHCEIHIDANGLMLRLLVTVNANVR